MDTSNTIQLSLQQMVLGQLDTAWDGMQFSGVVLA